jgi:phage-related protein
MRNLSEALTRARNEAEQANDWVFLLEIDVTKSELVNDIETLRFARSTESVTHDSQEYQPFPFAIGEQDESLSGELHTLEIGIIDLSGAVREYVRKYDLDGSPTRLILVRRDDGGGDAWTEVLREDFEVHGYSGTFEAITLSLATRNWLQHQAPSRRLNRSRCSFRFKDDGCGYVGIEEYCDYTFSGAYGCRAKENEDRFGGFPTLPPRQMG